MSSSAFAPNPATASPPATLLRSPATSACASFRTEELSWLQAYVACSTASDGSAPPRSAKRAEPRSERRAPGDETTAERACADARTDPTRATRSRVMKLNALL